MIQSKLINATTRMHSGSILPSSIITTCAAQRIARRYCFQQCLGLCKDICLFVRTFVCQHDNSWTVKDISTTFSEHRVQRWPLTRFENGDCEVRGWWIIAIDVLFCRRLANDSERIYAYDNGMLRVWWENVTDVVT